MGVTDTSLWGTSTASAFDRIIDRLEHRGLKVKISGSRAQAQCPAHDDENPSLSVRHIEGQALTHCFAGCDYVDVLAALNLTARDLYDNRDCATYRYDNGREVVRTADKRFFQRNTGKQPELYRLSEIKNATKAGQSVYLVEGEKDVHTLESFGVVATTAPQGASNIAKCDLSPLHGAKVIAVVDRDKQGDKWAQSVHQLLDGQTEALKFYRARAGKDATDHIMAGHTLDDLETYALPSDGHLGDDHGPQRRAVATPAAKIRTRAQKWFWRDRIPTGTISAFAGRGGEGKSSFAFHIAAEVSKGTLPGHLQGRARNVLIWSGEDEWATVVIPRLQAAGADLQRVHKLGIESIVDAQTLETSPNLPEDLSLIGKAVTDTDAALVVIDPISSTMQGDLNKEADTRRTLDGLARISHRTGAVVLAIRHFNKGGGNASDKMSGSHAFRDAARSVFLFAHDSETDQRIISQDKGNYSQHAGGSLAFTLESTDVITDDGNTANVARVVMLGESDVSVSDVINRNPYGDDEDEDRNAAQSFVLDYLEGRPNREAPAGQVIKAGRVAGFNETELKNARRRSRNPKIRSQKSGFGTGWVWAIEPDLDLEGATKVPKVPVLQDMTPTTPSMTPSQKLGRCDVHEIPHVNGECLQCRYEGGATK